MQRLGAVALAAWSLCACAQVPAAAGPDDQDPLGTLLRATVQAAGSAPAAAAATPADAQPARASQEGQEGVFAQAGATTLATPGDAHAADSPDPLAKIVAAEAGTGSASAAAAAATDSAAGPSPVQAQTPSADGASIPAATAQAAPATDAPGQAATMPTAPGEPLPPAPPPAPPVVLFPKRLGEFPPEPRRAPPPPPAAAPAVAAADGTPAAAGAAPPANDGQPAATDATDAATGAGKAAASEDAAAAPAGDTVEDVQDADTAPPVLRSQLPVQDPAEESVWRLGYSGRAAIEDNASTLHACPGGTLSNGIGRGLACSSTGEIKMKESLFSLDGGAQVQVVAKAKGTDATTVNGRPAAVDPYQLLPQFYTAVSGLSVLDGATMWVGRRDDSPFLMSSGLLPPNSPAMRFGVDNARFGDIALNYQYTTRNDVSGQSLPSYHSVRTAPIATNERGSVQLGFTRVEAQPLVQASGSAWWASAMHEQKGVLAGTNRFGLQFGEGARAAMTGYTGMGPALSRVRMAESLEWKHANGLGLAGTVESSLQFDRSPVGTLQWTATRVRPAYVASGRFKVGFEVAHDQISSGFGAAGQRTAFTVAPTLTLGKSAGNANLRAFYTYSRATDLDGIAFTSPADAWTSQNSGSVFGIQLNRSW